MNYNPYKIYQNGNSDKQHRQYLIDRIIRECPMMRYDVFGLHNGRMLNRLSTKQLEAKVCQNSRIYSKRVSKYVGWMNSVAATA
jgi:hypothetical protein